MPTINKKPVQVLPQTMDKNRERHKYYNSARWRNLRRIYMQQHPLCEECLENHIVNGGTPENPLQVHHINSPFDANLTEMERWMRLLDWNNLKTLCATCHTMEHNKKNKKKREKFDNFSK